MDRSPSEVQRKDLRGIPFHTKGGLRIALSTVAGSGGCEDSGGGKAGGLACRTVGLAWNPLLEAIEMTCGC